MLWDAALLQFPQGKLNFGIYNKIFRGDLESGYVRDAIFCASDVPALFLF